MVCMFSGCIEIYTEKSDCTQCPGRHCCCPSRIPEAPRTAELNTLLTPRRISTWMSSVASFPGTSLQTLHKCRSVSTGLKLKVIRLQTAGQSAFWFQLRACYACFCFETIQEKLQGVVPPTSDMTSGLPGFPGVERQRR